MPIRQNNFVFLLVALIMYLVVLPLLAEFDVADDKVIRVLAYSTLLVIGIWSLTESGKLFSIGVTIVLAAMVFNFISYGSERTLYMHATAGLLAVFLVMMLFATMKLVLLQKSVSVNRIFGAVCAYLLLGVIWALGYATLYEVSPDAFRGIGEADTPRFVDWIYYSFVTLSTLGYGDVTPASPAARVLAYTQAIFGVFYMAILVAGLVGIYISMPTDRKD